MRAVLAVAVLVLVLVIVGYWVARAVKYLKAEEIRIKKLREGVQLEEARQRQYRSGADYAKKQADLYYEAWQKECLERERLRESRPELHYTKIHEQWGGV